CREYFTEYPCAGSDAEFFHPPVEQFDAAFDIVFARTLQIGRDGLFGLCRGYVVEPVEIRMRIVRSDDFNLVAVLEGFEDGFYLVIDLCPDCLVPYIRMDVVCEIQ